VTIINELSGLGSPPKLFAVLKSNRFLPFGLSIILTTGMVWATNLISHWGYWYSDDVVYRFQTTALLKGSLSLGADPTFLDGDMAWAQGGVQQVWGLGVPAWRLPFEVLARLFGQNMFPDRLCFAFALFLIIYAVMCLFVFPSKSQTLRLQIKKLNESPDILIPVFLLILLPPFLNLCQARMSRYEEAAAYGYLIGVAICCGMVAFIRNPRLSSYLLLMFFAGLGPFFRPILMFYGGATVLISLVYIWRLKWKIWKSLLGLSLFSVGIVLLLITNDQRFGSPLEFGHKLNINGIYLNLFASRFQAPFTFAPFTEVFKELFSALFLATDKFNGYFYDMPNFFPWQSKIWHWREFYFKVYDLSFLLMIIGGWSWGIRSFYLGIKKRFTATTFEEMALLIWSLIASLMLFVFYLRCPFLSSRYMVDFAAAFGVALFIFFIRFRDFISKKFPQKFIRHLVFLMFAGWWIFQVYPVKIDEGFKYSSDQTHAAIMLQVSPLRFGFAPLPRLYDQKTNFGKFGIVLNGLGWDPSTATTEAALALFITNPKKLELFLGPAKGTTLTLQDYNRIQAKIGLEYLKLEGLEKTKKGIMMRFKGPQNKIYQRGIQVAFIGFATVENLSPGLSKFRLYKVLW
jgi:hypothetical protein